MQDVFVDMAVGVCRRISRGSRPLSFAKRSGDFGKNSPFTQKFQAFHRRPCVPRPPSSPSQTRPVKEKAYFCSRCVMCTVTFKSALGWPVRPAAARCLNGCVCICFLRPKHMEDFDRKVMPCVVQLYISRPLTLLGGYKFDLRVCVQNPGAHRLLFVRGGQTKAVILLVLLLSVCRYVLVASVRPLRLFIFRDGIVRICSVRSADEKHIQLTSFLCCLTSDRYHNHSSLEVTYMYDLFRRYEAPTVENLHNSRMHLSNFAINKETPPPSRSNDATMDGRRRSRRYVAEFVVPHCLEFQHRLVAHAVATLLRVPSERSKRGLDASPRSATTASEGGKPHEVKKSIAWFLDTVSMNRGQNPHDRGGWPDAKGAGAGEKPRLCACAVLRQISKSELSMMGLCRRHAPGGRDFWAEMDRLVCRSVLPAKHILELYHDKHFGNTATVSAGVSIV